MKISKPSSHGSAKTYPQRAARVCSGVSAPTARAKSGRGRARATIRTAYRGHRILAHVGGCTFGDKGDRPDRRAAASDERQRKADEREACLRDQLEIHEVLHDLDGGLTDQFPQQEVVVRRAREVTIDVRGVDADQLDLPVDEPRRGIRSQPGAPFDPPHRVRVRTVAEAGCVAGVKYDDVPLPD